MIRPRPTRQPTETDEASLTLEERRANEEEAELLALEQQTTERADVTAEARTRVQQQLKALCDDGVTEARALLKSLVGVPALESPSERGLAIDARRKALIVRRKAAEERRKCIENAERATLRAHALLKDLEDRLAALRVPRVDTVPEVVAVRPSAPVLPLHPKPAERRRQQRVRLDCEVGLETETNFYSGFAWDISTGGLFVASFDEVEIGREVDLAFTLPDGVRIEASAVVRWVRDHIGSSPHVLPGVGLQFVELEDGAREAIERFIADREPLFYVA